MAAPRTIRLAAAQYPVERHADLAAWRAKVRHWCAEGAAGGAELLLFPEYGAMEMTSLLPEAARGDLPAELRGLQTLWEPFRAAWREEAARHRIHIVAPSFPVLDCDGHYRNRALLIDPDGGERAQDKLIMTRFEREEWGVSPGRELAVFDTSLGRLAIAVCYDVEFPLLVRAAAEAGARLVLVPSCTDTEHGYHRVMVGARARALESQCIVVTSPTVGEAPWSPAIDVNVGAAGVFGPPDRGFPADGVLAIGRLNEPGWVTADVDLASVDLARAEGQVLNHRHWPEQDGRLAQVVVQGLER